MKQETVPQTRTPVIAIPTVTTSKLTISKTNVTTTATSAMQNAKHTNQAKMPLPRLKRLAQLPQQGSR